LKGWGVLCNPKTLDEKKTGENQTKNHGGWPSHTLVSKKDSGGDKEGGVMTADTPRAQPGQGEENQGNKSSKNKKPRKRAVQVEMADQLEKGGKKVRKDGRTEGATKNLQ